jgi:proline iminopeptidase
MTARQSVGTFKSKSGNIHYKVAGSGAPVLMVPGGPGSSHATFPRLEAHHTVVYFDPIGTGQSDRLANPGDYTVGLYAECMNGLLDQLGIRAAHIIGISFGGIPAAEFAARYPDRVLSLILSNAQVDAEGWQRGNIDAFNEHIRNQYPEIWEDILALRAAGVSSSDARYEKLFSVPNRRVLWAGVDPMPLPPSEGGTFDENTYLAFIGDDPDWSVGGTLRGHAVLDRLSKTKVPALVVTGRRDLMASPANSKRIADALGSARATSVVFERSAHRPWAEEADAYFELLLEFMARPS